MWQDNRAGYYDIYGQFFDNLGNTIGNNFKINDDSGTASQTYPDVAVSQDGTFLVVFQDQRSGFTIRGQRYNSSGDKLGTNFIIASASWCGNAVVNAAEDNTFIVAWEASGIILKKFSSNGLTLSSEISVSSTGRFPKVAIDGSGNFVVVWEGDDIYLQRFDRNCNKVGTSIRVNDDSGSKEQTNSSLDIDNAGNFIVVWCDYRNDNDNDIWNGGADLYAQKFNSSGARVNVNFMIHDCSDQDYYIDSDIAMTTIGDFVFTWEDRRGEDCDIYAQLYYANLSSKGNEFLVNDDILLPRAIVNPTSFDTTLRVGETVTKILTIENIGEGTLTYSITDKPKTCNFNLSNSNIQISNSKTNLANFINGNLSILKKNNIDLPQEFLTDISAGISIGMIRTGSSEYPYSRLTNLGYQITLIAPSSGLSVFQNYDIIYLPTNWADPLNGSRSIIESHASDYKNYIYQGGSLFIDQPNYGFTTTVLPYTITFDNWYDSNDWPPVIVNPNHEITKGLPENEMPGPADKMTYVAPEYEILVKGRKTNSPSLVVAAYGQGKMLVQTDNPSAAAFNPFSDRVYRRMVDWLATVHNDAQWLTESPNEGSIQPGQKVNINVTFNTIDLIPNTSYSAILQIQTNDVGNSLIEIPVQLTTLPGGDVTIIRFGEKPYWAWSFNQNDTVVVAIKGTDQGLLSDNTYLIKKVNFQFYTVGTIEFHIWEIAENSPYTILGGDLITPFNVNVTNTWSSSNPDIWQIITMSERLKIRGSQYIGYGFVLKQDAPNPKILTDSTTTGNRHAFVYTTQNGTPDWYSLKQQPMFQLYLEVADEILPKDSLQLIISFPAPSNNPSGIAFDGEFLWISDFINRSIHKITLSGQKLTTMTISDLLQPQGISCEGKNFWIADYDGFGSNDRILKVSSTGKILKSFKSPGDNPKSIEYTDGYLWIAESDKIYKADTSGIIITSFNSPGGDPRGIAYNGEFLWVCDFKTSKIDKINTMGAVIHSYPTPNNGPAGLAYSQEGDKEFLWYVDFRNDTIYKYQIVNSAIDVSSTTVKQSKDFWLSQSYPNPFNPTTTVTFGLPYPAEVTLSIFDLRGRLVVELFRGRETAGFHSVVWDASNHPTGTYFIRMQADNFVQVKKCVLLK